MLLVDIPNYSPIPAGLLVGALLHICWTYFDPLGPSSFPDWQPSSLGAPKITSSTSHCGTNHLLTNVPNHWLGAISSLWLAHGLVPLSCCFAFWSTHEELLVPLRGVYSFRGGLGCSFAKSTPYLRSWVSTTLGLIARNTSSAILMHPSACMLPGSPWAALHPGQKWRDRGQWTVVNHGKTPLSLVPLHWLASNNA